MAASQVVGRTVAQKYPTSDAKSNGKSGKKSILFPPFRILGYYELDD